MRIVVLLICLIGLSQLGFGQASKGAQPAASVEKQLLGRWDIVNADGGFVQFFPGSKLILAFGRPSMLVEYQTEKFGDAYKMTLRLPKFLEPIVSKEQLEYNSGEYFYISILDENTIFLILVPSEAEDWKSQLPGGLLLKKGK